MTNIERNAWIKRLWTAKVERRLTDSAYFVGRALLRFANRDDRAWPSKATLGAEIGRDERTVARALDALRAAGFLEWQQRRRRWNRQASNLYTLLSASCSAAPLPRFVPFKELKVSLNQSADALSVGSGGELPASVAAALARLGRALGMRDDAPLVM